MLYACWPWPTNITSFKTSWYWGGADIYNLNSLSVIYLIISFNENQSRWKARGKMFSQIVTPTTDKWACIGEKYVVCIFVCSCPLVKANTASDPCFDHYLPSHSFFLRISLLSIFQCIVLYRYFWVPRNIMYVCVEKHIASGNAKFFACR